MRFCDKHLERFYGKGVAPRWMPPTLRQRVIRKLSMLEAADDLKQLRVPPSNHLEKLRGEYEGYYSIRINQQFRLIYQWNASEGAYDVEFIDYH